MPHVASLFASLKPYFFNHCHISSPQQDGYAGIMSSEEEEDEQGNGDAPPGRLLEEGGGSDSQEDETDSDHTDDEDGDDSDSYDDGTKIGVGAMCFFFCHVCFCTFSPPRCGCEKIANPLQHE